MRSAPSILRLLFALLALGVAAAPAPADPPPAADDLADRHVRAAIDAIVEELYARKDPKHHWDPARWDSSRDGSKYQVGGYTALTVLALLHAGQSYQDPRLRDAVDWLAAAGFNGTYAVAQRAQVWARLPARFQENLERDIGWLMEGFSGDAAGWWYDQNPRTTRTDNSLRQYGVLAMWEAAQRGMKINERFWRMLEDAFLEAQRPDGGWNYRGDGDESTGSMTAAGLTVLYITQDLLHGDDAIRLRTSPALTANEEAIARGLAWMHEHYTPDENPGALTYFYYYSYGIERVGLASGRRRFGDHDWFRSGAAELLARLCDWNEAEGTMTVHERIRGRSNGAFVRTSQLAFALLYLSRGRVPVALNKLEVPGLAWNNRPRDAANLANWLGSALETELNWQVVSAETEAGTWLDASMLYLASHRPLPLELDERTVQALAHSVQADTARWLAGEADAPAPPPILADTPFAARLKRYLDLGGMLLAVNEGSSRAFAQSVEQLGSAIYPHLEWRDLPEDHWIYTLHKAVPGRRLRLRALSNGVRELIVIAPVGDLAATWQKREDERRTEHFDAMANLYLYASEMDRPRPRLDAAAASTAAGPAGPKPPATGSVRLARAAYDGGWNPEPQALAVLAEHLRARTGLDAAIGSIPLARLHEASPAPHVAVLSGTAPHELTVAERTAIADFVAAGGTLVVDTAGGTGGFAESIERQLEEAPGATLGPARSLLRAPVVTGAGIDGAADLTQVTYRPYALERFGTRETTNRLRGMPSGDRIGVIVSAEDLSQALLDQPRWGVSGYTAGSARGIMVNAVLAALAGK